MATTKKKKKKKVIKKKATKKITKKKVAKKKVAKKKVVKKRITKKNATKKKVVKKSTKKKVVRKKGAKKKSPVKKSKIISKKTKVLKPKSWSKFFSPLDNRVLVSKDGASDRTPGGLIIPAMVISDRPNTGTIVSVGRGHMNKKGNVKVLDVKVDDKVLFAQYSGNEIELEGEYFLILREEDILGVVE